MLVIFDINFRASCLIIGGYPVLKIWLTLGFHTLHVSSSCPANRKLKLENDVKNVFSKNKAKILNGTKFHNSLYEIIDSSIFY
jgi:hypothetical protein